MGACLSVYKMLCFCMLKPGPEPPSAASVNLPVGECTKTSDKQEILCLFSLYHMLPPGFNETI